MFSFTEDLGVAARVLVADDDCAFRVYIEELLEQMEFEVLTVSCGKDALANLCQQDFDLFITDIVMPEGEGLETIVKARELFPKMGILAISGAAFGSVYLSTAKMLGAHDILCKPFSPAELRSRICYLMRVVAEKEVCIDPCRCSNKRFDFCDAL